MEVKITRPWGTTVRITDVASVARNILHPGLKVTCSAVVLNSGGAHYVDERMNTLEIITEPDHANVRF